MLHNRETGQIRLNTMSSVVAVQFPITFPLCAAIIVLPHPGPTTGFKGWCDAFAWRGGYTEGRLLAILATDAWPTFRILQKTLFRMSLEVNMSESTKYKRKRPQSNFAFKRDATIDPALKCFNRSC